MNTLKLIGILMLFVVVSSVILGGNRKIDHTEKTPIKMLSEDEKRQAENDRKIAEAQVEYEKNQAAKKTMVSDTTSQNMDFASCKQKQAAMILELAGTNYKTDTIVNSGDMTMIRVCTDDGSVLITCSHADNKMIVKKSDGANCN